MKKERNTMSVPQSSVNGASPIAQQLAALHAHKQQNISPVSAPPLSPPPPKKTRFAWMGFTGKTAWDWLQLLIQLLGALAIPLVVVLATNALNAQQQQTTATQHKNDVAIADKQHQNDLAIADDQQKEATLKVYLDDLTTLLLNNHLHDSKPVDEVRNVAHIKTLATLRRLDGNRKGIVLQFLYEAHLIDCATPIVDLSRADLVGAYLIRANLIEADLFGADLRGADLRGADLRRAALSNATVTPTQLTAARSLKGTILPDGSTHP